MNGKPSYRLSGPPKSPRRSGFALLRPLSPLAFALIAAIALASLARADTPSNPRIIDRTEYAARLRAMWMGECIANWTGLKTEGTRINPPFFTDADWGTSPFPSSPWVVLENYTTGYPWGADDDTDIEYVYLHALSTLSANRLSPQVINQQWIEHVNGYIWVSNAAARNLMSLGVRPPMTALAQSLDPAAPGDQSLMIDAQLTTEFFGVFCPGMPERALDMADMPIRTTARGHAAHASQFYAILYSLASQLDHSQSGRDQALWLVREARKYIPDTSKAADIIDVVLADFLANPDINNWERTRDLVASRYQASAAANGFVYRAWYESSVNLAGGVICLLYGQMDFDRTIQIGTLSGWDSDNGTATMGGLTAFVQGQDFLTAHATVSDTFWIGRTRDNFPDNTPGPIFNGDDTFTLMARRMMPIIDREIAAAGGRVLVGPLTPSGAPTGTWILPPGGAGDGLAKSLALSRSPTEQEFARSANWSVRRAGGSVFASTSVPGFPQGGYGYGFEWLMCDGVESDWRGLEDLGTSRGYCSTQRSGGNPPAVEQAITVTYDRPVQVHTVRFIGGQHYTSGPVQGGWFSTIRVEALVNNQWTPQPLASGTVAPSTEPFPFRDFVLATPVQATAIRVVGLPGGPQAFVTCMELDALSAPPASTLPTFGRANIDDLYAWYATPTDLNADALADTRDLEYLESAIRFNEARAMSTPQRP